MKTSTPVKTIMYLGEELNQLYNNLKEYSKQLYKKNKTGPIN